MRSLLLLGAAPLILAVSIAGAAQAADPLTLQLKWVTQAQFAGYYVAKDKGFYEEENIDGQVDGIETALQATSAIEGSTQGVIDSADVETIVTDWKEQEEKLNEELEVADAETAKTDHTLWFKKTGWAEHIAGCTLRHLSKVSRLPDRNKHTLKKAVELNSILLERYVAGLLSLNNETW